MKRACVLSAIIVTVFFAACSSTKETPGVWVNKEKIQGKTYDNFFVVVMTADIEARVKLENEIAATITSRGHKAIKSYEVLPADLKDPKPPAVDAQKRIAHIALPRKFFVHAIRVTRIKIISANNN